ncbi:protein liaG [Paenibacillus riograndensis]|uniref:Protein liaG n=1 Tax=Paenibacillus riograndensis TaxID=483937 RepID=A0A132U2T7_9BACL|nr:protein liaG [Paenibacillus riograndensis]
MLSWQNGSERRSRRVGRYTASALLIAVGVLLFLDWRNGTDHMLILLKWWPIIAVLWGLEYLLISFFSRHLSQGRARSRSRMDLRGLLSAVVLAASVFIVSEQEHYLHLWNRVSLNLTAAAVDYGEAKGSKFQKAPVVIPVELGTSKITVDGINGDILIHRAPVEDIEVATTVWIDQLEGAVAEAISEQSFVDVTEGNTIKIIPKSKAYGDSGKRQPRMDLEISLPEDRRFNLEVRTMNGGITLQNVEAIEGINLETGNGELILHRIFGNVKGKTLNGAVRARTVQGSVDLATSGGDMAAWDVTGALKLSTAVGNISAAGSGDQMELSSKNGNLEINGARSKLQAESLNGKIRVQSADFGGNWDIYSAVGDIDLYLPVSGNYTVDGSSGYGDIVSDIPELTIDKKNISGEVGTGEFKLHVEGNSNLNVRKY